MHFGFILSEICTYLMLLGRILVFSGSNLVFWVGSWRYMALLLTEFVQLELVLRYSTGAIMLIVCQSRDIYVFGIITLKVILFSAAFDHI